MSILSSACANQLASLSNVILMFDPKLNESVPYVAELITVSSIDAAFRAGDHC